MHWSSSWARSRSQLSIVVGFFAAVVVGSALIVLAAVIGIRLWWLRRKHGVAGEFPNRGPGSGSGDSQTIEGEYHVVIEDQDDDRR